MIRFATSDQEAGTILWYAPSRSPHEVTHARLREIAAELEEIKAAVNDGAYTS